MLSSFLVVLPILIPPLCALALSCDQSPIPCEGFFKDRASRTICLGLPLSLCPPDVCLLSS
jgi:hypothetical protein